MRDCEMMEVRPNVTYILQTYIQTSSKAFTRLRFVAKNFVQGRWA